LFSFHLVFVGSEKGVGGGFIGKPDTNVVKTKGYSIQDILLKIFKIITQPRNKNASLVKRGPKGK
jgi:hypothetical protein